MVTYAGALEKRKDEHRLRSLRRCLPSAPGEIEIDGRNLINFASNDYLGLSHHEKVKRGAVDFVERYGAGATASRLLGGNLSVYEQIERKLALLKGTETALILPTGFQTNSTVLPVLSGANSTIAIDRLSHNSLLQGATAGKSRWFRFNHNDWRDLESKLARKYDRAGQGSLWIVTESVFGMDGDVAPLKAICSIASEFGASIFLDEAHACGVLGSRGMGFAEGLPNVVSMGTFGKGLGSFGAYVACSEQLRQYLINFAPGFIYSTALPPAVLGAVEAALDMVPTMQHERRQLAENAASLRDAIQQCGFNTGESSTHIIPIIVGSDQSALDLSSFLESNGIFAPAIRPPTVPQNSARVRISLTLDHTPTHMGYLIRSLKGWHERKD